MDRAKHRVEARDRIRERIRGKVRGTSERPRLAVFRSLNHISAQIIDDDTGRTLATADSRTKSFLSEHKTGGNAAAAKAVGTMLAEKAKAAGITRVVFDRGGYQYHGRVKALADGARAGGLEF